MNLIIKLSRPQDYRADEGARFCVEFEKARGVYGAAVVPFAARLTTEGWVIEGAADHTPAGKLREYLRLSAAANELPKSASAAIKAAHINKAEGLKAWGEMLQAGELEKTDAGFQLTGKGGSAVPDGSGTTQNHQNRFYGSTPSGGNREPRENQADASPDRF